MSTIRTGISQMSTLQSDRSAYEETTVPAGASPSCARVRSAQAASAPTFDREPRKTPLSAPAMSVVLVSMLLALVLSPVQQSAAMVLPALWQGQETSPAAPSPAPHLEIVAVDVTPARPGNETLCKLRVSIKNTDERPAYALGFSVSINGKDLRVYQRQLFMKPLPGSARGTTTEIDLFNFWTSETGRPAPENGKLEIRVSLTKAKWLQVSQDKAEDGTATEVWTPLGEVEGLPTEQVRVIDLDTKKGG